MITEFHNTALMPDCSLEVAMQELVRLKLSGTKQGRFGVDGF